MAHSPVAIRTCVGGIVLLGFFSCPTGCFGMYQPLQIFKARNCISLAFPSSIRILAFTKALASHIPSFLFINCFHAH